MRAIIRDKTHAADLPWLWTAFPAFDRSVFKGGPNSGVFLHITCDNPQDIDAPGCGYSFSLVKAAQAASDLAALVALGRRLLMVRLKDVGTGLAELSLALDEALV
jgi:transaldolase/glucose-6-phosphate isomerase